MAGLQQAINMPSNNKGARESKYTALVAALSGIPGALDGDGDIDFGVADDGTPNPIYFLGKGEGGWGGATGKFPTLNAKNQNDVLTEAVRLASSYLPRSGDMDVDIGPPPQSMSRESSLGHLMFQRAFPQESSGSIQFDQHNELPRGSSEPQSPSYGFYSPGLQQQSVPVQTFGTSDDSGGGSKSSSSAFHPIPTADDSGGGGGIGGGGPHSDLIQQRTNIFHAYQQEIMRLVDEIRQQRLELPGEHNRRALMRAVEEHVYALFFGHLADGTRTPFYDTHGAAPIAGMNAQELAYVAGVAKSLDRRLTQHSEDALGFLRDMLANITQSNRGAPFNYIYGLMKAVIGVHEAAQSLISANPLFAEHRNLVAQEGGYAVRTIPQHIMALLLRGGTKAVRSIFTVVDSRVGTSLATRYNNWVRAENRDGGMAIDGFQRALDVYDRVYQAMPARYENFLTLPFAPGMAGYDATQDRVSNKPDGEKIAQARQTWNPHVNGGAYPDAAADLVIQARGFVLENPIPCYPRFLTMHPPNEPGPLLAYFYALHGGQQQYLAEGRKWLEKAFATLGPEEFARQIEPLLGTLERIHQRALSQIQAGQLLVATPRTKQEVDEGGSARLQAKIVALAKPPASSLRANQPFVVGHDYRHQPPLAITSGAQLLAASTPAVSLADTQTQLRRERERLVRKQRQTEIANRAIARLQTAQAGEWRENLAENLNIALHQVFDTQRQGGTAAAKRLGDHFQNLAELLNRRINVRFGDGRTANISLRRIIIRLTVNNIEDILIKRLISPGSIRELKSNHPLMVFLNNRMNVGGNNPGNSLGVRLMIGYAAQALHKAVVLNQNMGLPYADSPFIPIDVLREVVRMLQDDPVVRSDVEYFNRARGNASGRAKKKQGGKRTRRHKMKRKRTRRHKMKRKRTRHHRKRKKHTRKH